MSSILLTSYVQNHVAFQVARETSGIYLCVTPSEVIVKMSIFVKNMNWSQTQTEVFVNIPIKIKKKSVENVVLDNKFLKINICPYFYELFFEQPICVEQSSCKILEANIKFHLKKETAEWWPSLGKTAKTSADLNDDHAIPIERKKEILDEYEKRVQENQTHKQKERSNLKRNEIEKEIERESQIRKQINETESSLSILQLKKVR